MDENGIRPVNYRPFARPLCLLSLVFFGLDIVIISSILLILLQLWQGSIFSALAVIIPVGFFPILSGGFILFLSCIGSILFVREMKSQTLPWKAGIPLCILFGLIIVSAIVFVSQLFPAIQIYPIYIAIAGFMSLPCGVAYLLRDFKEPEFEKISRDSNIAGIYGLIVSSALIISLILLTGSWSSDLIPVLIVVLFFGIIHVFILMPLLGVKLFQLGRSLSKIPPAEGNTGEPAEPVPRKKIRDIIRDIPLSMSPRAKWTILVLVVLILVVAGCFVYWDITDTTPGRVWTEVTKSAPFGSLSGFTSVEYKGNLWIIGGADYVGNDGEAWYTNNGVTWTRVSSPSVVPQRIGASSAVFRDAMWVIGGKTDETKESHNDVWYSSDGRTWWDIQPAAEFAPRFGHNTVIFNDRIWVIGGNLDNTDDNPANDVWYSDNGISWKQATPAAEFSPRFDHSSFVYHDKIWVIGGRNSHDYLYDAWYSGDGIHWTQAIASAPFGDTSIKAVLFDDRIWVLQTTFGKKENFPWGTEKSQGIWYSYDGITWTKVMSSPGFFDEGYSGRQPVPVVFDNRLFVLQQYNRGTGIWYTMPEGSVS